MSKERLLGEKGNVTADLASAVVGSPSLADHALSTGANLAGTVVDKSVGVGIDIGVDHVREKAAKRDDGEDDRPVEAPQVESP
jgi:hypothetical protein